MKLPLCPEVCKDCQEGVHILHIITELADLRVTKRTFGPVHGSDWKPTTRLVVEGWAEDEDFLVELIQVANHAISKEEK